MSLELHRCFRCGWCKLPSDFSDYNCPSYARFRFESFSPGGRLWLIRAWQNGELDWSDRLSEILFSCVACKNCAEQCKMGFKGEILDWITSAKSNAIEKGLTPPKVRDFLENLVKHGNPWGFPRSQRASWTKELKKYEGEEFLLYLGCECSYEERGIRMANSVAEILKLANVSFGILGNEEECDGNEALMIGEFGLFQQLASKNLQKFAELGVRRVLAISPHAYNAMKRYSGSFEVFHFTQLFYELIKEGKLKLSRLNALVTYHDPCFLGRHNQIYEEPREILRSIPGIKLVEMRRNRENAFCCGGGSGNFVFDLLRGSNSPARLRVKEALETGAEILAVACPICKAMLEDAVKEGFEGKIEVRDIAEIVLESARI